MAESLISSRKPAHCLLRQWRLYWLIPTEPPDLPDTFNVIETGLLGHPVMVLHKLDGTTDVAVCLVSHCAISQQNQPPSRANVQWLIASLKLVERDFPRPRPSLHPYRKANLSMAAD